MNELTELFGKELIYAYTRKQAVEDGLQVHLPVDHELVKNAGIKVPVYITRAVWDAYVEVPPGVKSQDETGRLWDILWMFRCATGQHRNTDRFQFQLHVRNKGGRRLVTLLAAMGPVDIDDPQPAITIMLPDED